MRRLLFNACKWTWYLSYHLYGFQPPAQPTVGGFWTRLVFLPLVLAFVPIYWLSVCLWPLGLLALSLTGLMNAIPYGLVIVFTGLGTVALSVILFGISKSHYRHAQPECPQIYHAVTWPIRLVINLSRRYEAACDTPLEL